MKKIKRILLVDDDDITNFLHQKLIDYLNIAEETQVLTRADKALEFLRENSKEPQAGNELIFLDLNIPVMDGCEFLEELASLEIEKKPKVVVVSSSESSRDLERVQSLNIAAFVPKPLTEEKIMLILEQVANIPSDRICKSV